MIPTIYSKKI